MPKTQKDTFCNLRPAGSIANRSPQSHFSAIKIYKSNLSVVVNVVMIFLGLKKNAREAGTLPRA